MPTGMVHCSPRMVVASCCCRDVDHDALAKLDGGEVGEVAVERDFVVRAAVGVVEDGARHAAARVLAKVFDAVEYGIGVVYGQPRFLAKWSVDSSRLSEAHACRGPSPFARKWGVSPFPRRCHHRGSVCRAAFRRTWRDSRSCDRRRPDRWPRPSVTRACARMGYTSVVKPRFSVCAAISASLPCGTRAAPCDRRAAPAHRPAAARWRWSSGFRSDR